ncbi:MAG: 4Fe-4S binding protein [Elainellaceae cyanobacterium]
MFNTIPEPIMHRVRWLLTAAWLTLIASLFYDPISPWLTQAAWSPLRLDPQVCVSLQGRCLVEQPYALGAPIFWGLVVPSAIFILLAFGHELWRRVCPLSFVSQIARALGIQRQIKRTHPKTGKVRFELVKVKKDGWLAKHHSQLQFGLLFIGLCSRILFVNSSRWLLGLFLLGTIVAAITVGYLYGGKAWCQYFCPMAPVQRVYAEPRGLLTSTAHDKDSKAITQSMCRTVEAGKEHSACVACCSPCIDIDSERLYWNTLRQPERRLIHYGYIGLAVGYFLYYFLYAGNWEYYLSGAWAHQEDQLATLLSPGFYFGGHAVPVPKLLAVPLTLGITTALGLGLGHRLERSLHRLSRSRNPLITAEEIQNRVYALLTFGIFNFFFIFGGRNFIRLLPTAAQWAFEGLILVVSALWLARTWSRSPERYSREGLAMRLRRQLQKLDLNLAEYLDGRSLNALSADEVYVLAKVLPGFTEEKRHQAYRGVLREALEEGYTNSLDSLHVLQQVRIELGITPEVHQDMLVALGHTDPALLDPSRQRSREDRIRLQAFRNRVRGIAVNKRRRGAKGLGAQLWKVVKREASIQSVLAQYEPLVRSLRQAYDISPEDEDEVIRQISREHSSTGPEALSVASKRR